jgi:hypothetical protein
MTYRNSRRSRKRVYGQHPASSSPPRSLHSRKSDRPPKGGLKSRIQTEDTFVTDNLGNAVERPLVSPCRSTVLQADLDQFKGYDNLGRIVGITAAHAQDRTDKPIDSVAPAEQPVSIERLWDILSCLKLFRYVCPQKSLAANLTARFGASSMRGGTSPR